VGIARSSIVRYSRTLSAPLPAVRSSLLLVLGPAEYFPHKAQGFVFWLLVLRSLGNGALECVDQLGDGREDRAVVGGDGASQSRSRRLTVFSGMRRVPFFALRRQASRRESRHPPVRGERFPVLVFGVLCDPGNACAAAADGALRRIPAREQLNLAATP
jgi:hypothetical protein